MLRSVPYTDPRNDAAGTVDGKLTADGQQAGGVFSVRRGLLPSFSACTPTSTPADRLALRSRWQLGFRKRRRPAASSSRCTRTADHLPPRAAGILPGPLQGPPQWPAMTYSRPPGASEFDCAPACKVRLPAARAFAVSMHLTPGNPDLLFGAVSDFACFAHDWLRGGSLSDLSKPSPLM